MGSALAVHVGEKMVANLEIAISNGTWGCPGPQGAHLAPGDLVLFGGGVPGGPRQNLSGGRPIGPDGAKISGFISWMDQTASFLILCRATSTWYVDHTPIWDGDKPYEHRFDFELIERFSDVPLTRDLNLSSNASRALQMSALGGGKSSLQCQNFGADGLYFLEEGIISEATKKLEPLSFQGDLDVPATRAARAEQNELRTRLLEKSNRCAICGRALPTELLVAAHIKKRSECTDDEKRDLNNVAMLACVLGCDALFEHGYILVDKNGVVKVNQRSEAALRHKGLFVDLVGRQCPAHTLSSEKYFSWHREAHR